MKCKRCGNWIPDGSDICMFCGQKQNLNDELSSDFNQGDFFDNNASNNSGYNENNQFYDTNDIYNDKQRMEEQKRIEENRRVAQASTFRTLSIIGLILSFLFPAFGLGMAIYTFVKMPTSPGSNTYKNMSLASIIISSIFVVIYILLPIFW